MSSRYILVDSENIKPQVKILASFLEDERSQLLIFTNSQQQFPAEMSKFLQPYGRRVEYIVMSGGGKNALDFLLAFYLGKIINADPESEIQIISGDKGFVPLINHVKQTGVKKLELRTLDNNDTLPGKVRRRVTRICEALEKEHEPWPASRSALANFIRTVLSDCKISESHLAALLDFMLRKELVSITDDDRLNFNLVSISEAAKGLFAFKTNTDIPQKISPAPEPVAPPDPYEEAVFKICVLLKKKGDGRPKKFQTLFNTVKIHLALNSEGDVEGVLDCMEKKGILSKQTGSTKIAYDVEKIEAEAENHAWLSGAPVEKELS